MERPDDERVVVAVVAEDTPWCATGPELVADRLFVLGASAVSELPGADPGVAGARSVLRMVADLPIASLDALSDSGLSFDVLEVDPSWKAGWHAHAVAAPVGDRLVLRPEWVPRGGADGAGVVAGPADRERIDVVLDAADAFGSGSHPTTRMCLEAVERLGSAGALAGARVLDVGCGTGVLGVAALLLADRASLVAVDVEPAAVLATVRTAELNGVADRVVEVSHRSLVEVVGEHGPFDVVLANLLIPIIESLGDALAAAVAPGGHLVMSGLLADPETGQVDRAVGAVRDEGLVVDGMQHDGGWAAIALRRGESATT